jgi:hypothetical protein
MPFKIIMQGDHGEVLDDRTVKSDDNAALQAALVELVEDNEWRSGDRITILSMSAVEVENEDFWNKLLEDVRRNG